MTYLFETEYPNLSYKDVIRSVLANGQKIAPRGVATTELQPAIHHVKQPWKKLCSVPGRKANPFFNMAENMWILGGHGNSDWICSFNNKLAEFQSDEGHQDFNAPYGRRIRFANRHRSESVNLNPYNSASVKGMPQVDQLEHCYRSLQKDPASRQAVISLWNPVFDYYHIQTKDRPCNTTIYFKIRDGKLNMTVSNRSNDLHLGLYGVNFVQFAHIQEFLAAALNVQIGHYVHMSDSLHIYDNSQHTKNILESEYDFDVYQYVEPMILNHDQFKLESGIKDPNFGDFLNIPDQVMAENVRLRKDYLHLDENGNLLDESRSHIEVMWPHKEMFRFCQTKYAKSCAKFLFAYDLYKVKQYETATRFVVSVFEDGFKDWAILGLEFFMRNEKYHAWANVTKDGVNFMAALMENYFTVNDHSKAITEYIYGH